LIQGNREKGKTMPHDQLKFANRRVEAHAGWLINVTQRDVDRLASRLGSDAAPVPLSNGENFLDLKGMAVALDQRALQVTDEAGQSRIVSVKEFINANVYDNYGKIDRFRRALGQRTDGQPLCSGTGIESPWPSHHVAAFDFSDMVAYNQPLCLAE
jgi:hypothetical protein